MLLWPAEGTLYELAVPHVSKAVRKAKETNKQAEQTIIILRNTFVHVRCMCTG